VNDEERIRAYLRQRADVSAPDELRWPTSATAPRRRWAIGSPSAWARLAVAGLVLAVGVGVLLRLPTSTGPATLSSPRVGGSSLSNGHLPDAMFPSEVDGLPVTTVAEAVDLLRSGKLDGQAVAVAGYYDEIEPSCPFPGRYIGPLERWCRFDALADTPAGAQLCRPYGNNGMSCQQPTGTYLSPFFMSETSGSVSSSLTGGAAGEPAALVLIGHVGDPRQWQCTAATHGECANAFVVDRIAWAQGQGVPLTAPQIGDQQSGASLTPKMTLAHVAAALGLGDRVVSGAAFKVGDIATVDPRWTLAGDNLVWLVRSLAPAAPSQGEPTRPETVWLVDDATGRTIDRRPLKLDATYRPARLWLMATVHGVDCCGTNVTAFQRVESIDGTVVHEGIVSGSATGGPDYTTFGGGYGSEPLVLPAGGYSITTWLATYDRGVMGTPSDECSTQVTLRSLDDVTLNAAFPAGQACAFKPGPSASPTS
jgi:hypothetical protein